MRVFFFLRLSLFFCFILCVSATLDSNQYSGLVDFYENTNGPNWSTNTNWLNGDPCENSWYGLTCNTLKTVVTEITLEVNSLSGDLPNSIINSNFTSLEHLNLYANSLTGALDSYQWDSLTSLNYLSLAHNQLYGTLPETWGAKIQYISLELNAISGTIPKNWVNYQELNYISMYTNNFDEAPLPEEWSSLTKLTTISLFQNKFNSTLPESWSSLSLLKTLLIHNNQLIGTLPESWGEAFSGASIEISQNYISGTIPQSWETLLNNSAVEASNCYLVGPLPDSVQPMVNTHLENNYFDCPLPDWCGNGISNICAPCYTYPTASWKNETSLPFDLNSMGYTSDPNYVYSISGVSDNFPVQNTLRYNIQSNTWENLQSYPYAVSYPSACYNTSGVIYSMGGRSVSGYYIDNAYSYSISENQWNELPPMQIARFGIASASLGDKVYAIGGANQSSIFGIDSVEIFDINSNSWSFGTNFPYTVYGASAVTLNGKIYVLGGFNSPGDATSVTNEVQIYDPLTQQWSSGVNFNTARSGFGAVVLESKIYIAGGTLGAGNSDTPTVEVFDSNTNSWSFLPDLPVAVDALGLGAFSLSIIAFGGYDIQNHDDLDTTQSLNISQQPTSSSPTVSFTSSPSPSVFLVTSNTPSTSISVTLEGSMSAITTSVSPSVSQTEIINVPSLSPSVSSSSPSSSNAAIIVISILAVIVLCIICIGILSFIVYKKKKNLFKTNEYDETSKLLDFSGSVNNDPTIVDKIFDPKIPKCYNESDCKNINSKLNKDLKKLIKSRSIKLKAKVKNTKSDDVHVRNVLELMEFVKTNLLVINSPLVPMLTPSPDIDESSIEANLVWVISYCLLGVSGEVFNSIVEPVNISTIGNLISAYVIACSMLNMEVDSASVNAFHQSQFSVNISAACKVVCGQLDIDPKLYPKLKQNVRRLGYTMNSGSFKILPISE